MSSEPTVFAGHARFDTDTEIRLESRKNKPKTAGHHSVTSEAKAPRMEHQRR